MNVSICKKYIVRSPFLHLTFLASIWSAHRELVYRHYTHHCTQCAIFVFIKVFFSELTYFVMSLRSNQIWSKFNVCKAPFTLHFWFWRDGSFFILHFSQPGLPTCHSLKKFHCKFYTQIYCLIYELNACAYPD